MKNYCAFRQIILFLALFEVLEVHPLELSSAGVFSISQSANSFRVGDDVRCQELNWSDNIWDLSESAVKEDSISDRFSFLGNSLTRLRFGNRYYYRADDNHLLLVGNENNQEVLSFDEPEILLNYPFSLNDSIQGIFFGHGVYCARYALYKYGWYLTKFVKMGILRLPNGSDVPNVGLVRTERVLLSKTYPIDDKRKGSIECNYKDTLIAGYISGENLEREEIQRLYVKGCRYPVVESYSRRKYSNDSLILRRMFYFPMDEQCNLSLDEENMRIRKQLLAQGEDSVLSVGNNAEQRAMLLKSYQFKYNDTSHQAKLVFDNQEKMQVSVVLTDTQGRVFKRQEANGILEEVSIDCCGLPYGQYLLYVNVNDNLMRIEKFNVK